MSFLANASVINLQKCFILDSRVLVNAESCTHLYDTYLYDGLVYSVLDRLAKFVTFINN